MTEKKKRGRPRKKKVGVDPVDEVVKDLVSDILVKPVIEKKKQVSVKVPNLSHLPKITIYACKTLNHGYKYYWNKPPYPVSWEKEMTGMQATQLLRKVKARNKDGKLESKVLIDSTI